VNKRSHVNPPVVVPFRGFALYFACMIYQTTGDCWWCELRPRFPYTQLRTLDTLVVVVIVSTSSQVPGTRHQLSGHYQSSSSGQLAQDMDPDKDGLSGGCQYRFHGRWGNRLTVAVPEFRRINLLTTIKWITNEYAFVWQFTEPIFIFSLNLCGLLRRLKFWFLLKIYGLYSHCSDARRMGVCCRRGLIAPDPLGPSQGFSGLPPAFPPKNNHSKKSK